MCSWYITAKETRRVWLWSSLHDQGMRSWRDINTMAKLLTDVRTHFLSLVFLDKVLTRSPIGRPIKVEIVYDGAPGLADRLQPSVTPTLLNRMGGKIGDISFAPKAPSAMSKPPLTLCVPTLLHIRRRTLFIIILQTTKNTAACSSPCFASGKTWALPERPQTAKEKACHVCRDHEQHHCPCQERYCHEG